METRRRTDAIRVGMQGGILCVCCAVALGVHRLASADVLDDGIELAVVAAALLALAALAALSVFATRRADRQPARLALAAMSLGCLAILATFTWSSYPDASIALADLVAPAAAADGGGSLVLGPSDLDVRLSGDVGDGTADRLEALLAAHPSVSRIHLTSEGGLADEGQALGEVIAAHHLTTYVPDYCVSACTLAFVAGRQRLVEEGGRLGFHKPFYEGVLGQSFAGDASAQRAAYLAAGLTPAFVDEALKVAPDDAWFPDGEELLSAHVATKIVGRDALPDSMLDGAATRQGARSVLLRNFPALEAVDRAAPKVVDAIADRFLNGYRRGHSEARDTDDLKAAVRRVFAVSLLHADDATLLDLARYLSSAMQAVASSEPDVCAAIGEKADLLGAETVLGAAHAEADVRATRLVAAALRDPRARTNEPTELSVRAIALKSAPDCGLMKAVYARMLQRRDPAPLRMRLEAASRS